MSLCRLWQQQGKQKKVRQTLADVYGWFTEGFETADLQEARALLKELTEQHRLSSRGIRSKNPRGEEDEGVL